MIESSKGGVARVTEVSKPEDPKHQQDWANMHLALRAYLSSEHVSPLGLATRWAKVTVSARSPHPCPANWCFPCASTSFTPLLCLVLFVLSFFESKILRSGILSWPTSQKLFKGFVSYKWSLLQANLFCHYIMTPDSSYLSNLNI